MEDPGARLIARATGFWYARKQGENVASRWYALREPPGTRIFVTTPL